MIAQRMNRNWNMSSDRYSVADGPGILNRSAFAESGPRMVLIQNPEHAECDSSAVFQRYIAGIRYLARKKQRRCISQELG